MKKPSIDMKALKAGGWRPLVTTLCVLLGLWMCWKAYSVSADQRLTETVELKRAQLVQSVIENPYLNGTVIRLDGAVRMGPK